jgi:hypothetical protein
MLWTDAFTADNEETQWVIPNLSVFELAELAFDESAAFGAGHGVAKFLNTTDRVVIRPAAYAPFHRRSVPFA